MKTIQMTIDDDLLAEVDLMTTALQTTRSAFIRSALHLALRYHAMLEKSSSVLNAMLSIGLRRAKLLSGKQSSRGARNESGRRLLVYIQRA